MQAQTLANILAADRPTDLADAFDDAMSRSPKWKTRIEQSLERTPIIAKLIKSAREAA